MPWLASLCSTLFVFAVVLTVSGMNLDRDRRQTMTVIRVTEPWIANGYRLDPAPAGLHTKLLPSDAVELALGRESFLSDWVTDSTRIEVWFGINMGLYEAPRAGESPAPGVVLTGREQQPGVGRPVYIVRLKGQSPCQPDAPPGTRQLLCYLFVSYDADTGERAPPGGTSTGSICPIAVPRGNCRD